MHKIISIACLSENNGIGYDNQLLFDIPEDMQFFINTTRNNTVLMGRCTYESMGSAPLKDRLNIVITSSKNITETPNLKVFNNIEAALKWLAYNAHNDIYIIGGGIIYSKMQNIIDEMLITHVPVKSYADVFYPLFTEADWNKYTVDTFKSKYGDCIVNRYIRKKKCIEFILTKELDNITNIHFINNIRSLVNAGFSIKLINTTLNDDSLNKVLIQTCLPYDKQYTSDGNCAYIFIN